LRWRGSENDSAVNDSADAGGDDRMIYSRMIMEREVEMERFKNDSADAAGG